MQYALAVGGSGAKCGEAVVYAAAAGLMRGELTMRFVDIDSESENARRGEKALALYARLYHKLASGQGDRDLFKVDFRATDAGAYIVQGDDTRVLDAFVNAEGAASADQQIYGVLFDKKSRSEMRLNNGVKGRPNFGQVIFAKNVDPALVFPSAIADHGGKFKLHIFGSIYGGTGAAGIPTLARIFKRDNRIAGAKRIGISLLLPYFHFRDVTGDVYAVKANSLAQRAAVALDYYHDHYMRGRNPLFDAVYFVGKDPTDEMPCSAAGGREQDNPSSIVELFAALHCEHFFNATMATGFDTNREMRSRVSNLAGNHFGWNSFPAIAYDGMDADPHRARNHLVAMLLCCYTFTHYFVPFIRDIRARGQSWRAEWYVRHVQNSGMAHNDDDLNEVLEFCCGYIEWVTQMQSCAPGESVKLFQIGTLAKCETTYISGILKIDDAHVNSIDLMHDIVSRLSRAHTARKSPTYMDFFGALFECCIESIKHALR